MSSAEELNVTEITQEPKVENPIASRIYSESMENIIARYSPPYNMLIDGNTYQIPHFIKPFITTQESEETETVVATFCFEPIPGVVKPLVDIPVYPLLVL